MSLKITELMRIGTSKIKPVHRGAIVALCMSLAGFSNPASAEAVTVTHSNGTTTRVEISRPGQATGSFSMTVAKLIWPQYFGLQPQDCIDASQIYKDEIQASIDILSYLFFGDRFCPDQADINNLQKSCGDAEFRGWHPRREDLKGREGDDIRFVRDVYYGKMGGGWDTIRDIDAGWIYYGWGDCWNRAYFDSDVMKIKCDSATFGDPKPGVKKMCFYERPNNSNHYLVKFHMKHFHHT
ncbi:MAG: hypothetical protein AB8B84_16760 [Granulosicoccus sp.]